MLREQLRGGVGARVGAPCASFVLLGRMMARAIFHPLRESGTTRPSASATGVQPIESGIRIPPTDRAVNSRSCRRWIAVPKYGTRSILLFAARDVMRRFGASRFNPERREVSRARSWCAPPGLRHRNEWCYHPSPASGSGSHPRVRGAPRRSVARCARARGASDR